MASISSNRLAELKELVANLENYPTLTDVDNLVACAISIGDELDPGHIPTLLCENYCPFEPAEPNAI